MSQNETDLRSAVLTHVQRSNRRQTSADVTASISREKAVAPKRVRSAIRSLLDAQRLMYSYELGSSFLVENFHRSWQPAPHIWILPPECSLPEAPAANAVVIRLGAGAAFGGGEHPTTRLCLEALDHLYSQAPKQICFKGNGVYIGTGSGILALAAAQMGSRSILALDTDPCARAETRANIALNHLGRRIKVAGAPFETLTDACALILANLRYPTLLQMLPWASEHLLPEGRLVVSGVLDDEMQGLVARFEAAKLHLHWRAARKRWSAGIFGLNPP